VGKYAPNEAEVVIIEGTPNRKRNAIEHVAKTSGLVFAIITYESVSALRNEISETGFHMFILDEATKIKNPKAARSKATTAVCSEIEYGVELTGLAYLNNPVDLFSQFLALDETVYGTDQWSFSEHYIDFVKAPFGRMMRGLKHVDELKRRAYFIAFSRSKKDCLDLPEKTYITRTLPMYDTQKTWYDKLSAEVLAEVPPEDAEISEVNVTNVLTKLEKLQQVTAGFVIKDDGETIWFDSPKYAEVCDTIQESTESFIIWARHTEAMKRMSAALLQRNIVSEELNRYTSTHRRIQGIKQFKEGKLRVLICQLQSESKGLDLTCKTNSVNAIYLENTFSIDDRWQSESRQHRIGMQGTATYIDLVLEDTVDEHILEILKGKFRISEYIAKMGLDIVLGKGGSVVTRKSRSKKQLPTPEDHVEFDDESMDGIEGFEDIVDIARRKKASK
jgi:SNF2 family DNA or RNA helicase